MAQKILLFCGILAPLLYFGIDRLAGRLLKGYNFAAESMSELSSEGSPVRSLVVWLTLVASALLVAFGVGVWREAAGAWLTRLVGALLIVNALAGLIAMLFYPNRFGERPSFASPGVLLMFLSVLSFVLAFVLGAFAFGGWMRILSILIPVTYILLAAIRYATVSAGGAQVLIGAQERTMAYSFLLWVVALAVYLLLLSNKAFEP